MPTEVVNIRYSKYDQYIGRAGHSFDGYFGNSHLIGYCKICNKIHTREEAIAAYKIDFDKKIQEDPEFKKRVLELKDKKLGCFCAPRKCHGDVLANYVNEYFNIDERKNKL